ncbi:MAG: aminoacyl-tRNA hydrolase [Candidatus Sericytochromatia bacterium]|nr:aminoacyl-tRNA hydrolase [Candidatus Sericytochromatia bacterium]
MKLVVGLGNPGAGYADTRHNVGWLVLDALADALGAEPFKADKRHRAEVADARDGARRLHLVKPQTYMNLSGESVGALMRFWKLTPKDVLVVYDDLAIPLGTVRVRPDGSAGGHNGIKSLLAHLGTPTFDRVRVGIGPQPAGMKSEVFVLGRWSPSERLLLPEAVRLGLDATRGVLAEGVERAMGRFNGVKTGQEREIPAGGSRERGEQ